MRVNIYRAFLQMGNRRHRNKQRSLSYHLKCDFQNTKNCHVKEAENFEAGPVLQSAHSSFKDVASHRFLPVKINLGALGYKASKHLLDCRAGLSFV